MDATLVDRKFHKRVIGQEGRPSYQIWDHMVEFPGPDGQPKRLVIREKTFWLIHKEPGETVPILVNRKMDKAMFDLNDPRIDSSGDSARKERKQRDEDDARFERKLSGEE